MLVSCYPVADLVAFRRRLLRWYDRSRRPLPWRETDDPWRILVSEIMLQQTRVEAVVPYYERFLVRFPDARALADASESEVLATWSGLGYYSRARNLQKTAAAVASGFPFDYESIRALPGIGPYTAAAVSSIAFGLPHAAVDGNVLRVIARVTADAGDIATGATRARFTVVAQELLDPHRPGDFNQAMMELGATVCQPRSPYCLVCPVAKNCQARAQARQNELPVKRAKGAPVRAAIDVVVVRRGSDLLLRQRDSAEKRMAGFWELPAPLDIQPKGSVEPVASFRHTIVNTIYTVNVVSARVHRLPRGMRWVRDTELETIPLTTVTRKALELARAQV